MKIYKSIEELKIENSIISIGKFDGLHTGHRKVIEEMNKLKEKMGIPTVIFTFISSPKDILNKEKSKKILTEEEKVKFFEMQGIDYLIICEDVENIIKMSREAFAFDVLFNKLGMKALVCGTDFKFGKDRLGDVTYLKELQKENDFCIDIIDIVKYDDVRVSSTAIKEAILKGDMEMANNLLSREFSFIGTVSHGAHLGTGMGMPTVNLIPDEEKILPPFGVYSSIIIVDDKEYKGITNIGKKPTVSSNDEIGVETHIFDVNFDIYGEIIEVKLLEYVRPEKKFADITELVNQVNGDIKYVKEQFRKKGRLN